MRTHHQQLIVTSAAITCSADDMMCWPAVRMCVAPAADTRLHAGDITLTLLGFILQVVSIVCDATRCCALQKVLQTNHIEVGPLVTLAYVAPAAAAALTLPALLLEGPRLLSDYDKWKGAVPMVLLSGLFASILNFVVFKIIRLTSALTTSLSGVLKEWACILVAMTVYKTKVTQLQWLGYAIAIAGLMW